MDLDLTVILDAIRKSFANPTADLTTTMIVAASMLLLMLIVVMGLLLVMTPKRRKVIRIRRYRVAPGADAGDVTSTAANAGESGPAVTAEAVEEAVASSSDEGAPDDASEPGSGRFARLGAVMTSAFTVPLLIAAALVAGYVVTGTNAMCAGACHAGHEGVDAATRIAHARCVQCHEAPGVSGIAGNAADRGRMLLAKVRGRTPGTAVVDSDACAACHWRDIAVTVESARGIRMSHRETDEGGLTCVSCHATTGHDRRRDYSMSTCIGCHGGGSGSIECDTCHVKDPYDASARAAVSDESSATMGSGAITYPVVSVGFIGCGGCHEETRECDSCHGLRMPHTEEFVARGHAEQAAFERKQLCYEKCHTPGECTSSCHHAFETSHPGDWKSEHARSPRDSGCVCHQARSGRTEPMCVLCHNF